MSLRPVFLVVLSACLMVAPPAWSRPLFRVAIDPGHGGTHLGARSPTGVLEKDVTLRAARLLADTLSSQGVQVFLTRSRDRYLSLAARARLANAFGAHVLISLHCNASPQHDQQGYEAFVAPPDRATADAPASAGQLSPPAFLDGAATELAVARALGDLRAQAVRARSLALGKAVMGALRSTLGPRGNRGLQQAPFDVLLGARMPAVLVEMGFLDHRVEGRRLARLAYLRRVVRAIAQAVLTYGRSVLRLDLRAGRAPDRLPGPDAPERRRDRRRPPPGDRLWHPKRRPQVAFEPAA